MIQNSRNIMTLAPLVRVGQVIRLLVMRLPLLALPACGVLNDPATDLADAIEAGVDHLGRSDGASYAIEYEPPTKWVERGGSYTVQLDKVGALIVWYKAAGGQVTASGSTSYHARFVDTPRTYIVDKPANSVLAIDIERQNGRAVIANVQ